MSRRAWWLDAETDEVADELVAAARRYGPSPAARARLTARLRGSPNPAPPRVPMISRAVSYLLGWTGAAAAAPAGAGKGIAIATTLSVVKWVGLGAVAGASTVGVATKTGFISLAETRPMPSFVTAAHRRPSERHPPNAAHTSQGLTQSAVEPTPTLETSESPSQAAIVLPELPSQPPLESPATMPPHGNPQARAAPASSAPGISSSLANSARSPTRLAMEVARLDAARAKLRVADAWGALALLSHYRDEFPQGALTNEASLIRVNALLATGQRDNARAEAERLLARSPPPPLVEQVRKLMNQP